MRFARVLALAATSAAVAHGAFTRYFIDVRIGRGVREAVPAFLGACLSSHSLPLLLCRRRRRPSTKRSRSTARRRRFTSSRAVALMPTTGHFTSKYVERRAPPRSSEQSRQSSRDEPLRVCPTFPLFPLRAGRRLVLQPCGLLRPLQDVAGQQLKHSGDGEPRRAAVVDVRRLASLQLQHGAAALHRAAGPFSLSRQSTVARPPPPFLCRCT